MRKGWVSRFLDWLDEEEDSIEKLAWWVCIWVAAPVLAVLVLLLAL